MNDNKLQEFYDTNEDFRNYIDRFCKLHNISKEEAFTHKVIREDIYELYGGE